jgi:hypothetical protein
VRTAISLHWGLDLRMVLLIRTMYGGGFCIIDNAGQAQPPPRLRLQTRRLPLPGFLADSPPPQRPRAEPAPRLP